MAEFWSLHPGAAAHPEVHNYWGQQHKTQGPIKDRGQSPTCVRRIRGEEVHPKEARHKSQRHEEGGDDSEGFHDFVHAIVDDR